ncbi:MAG: carboxypeptidase regulatory-like domain-containing protein [Myxococcales bacterium]|nr:MAG: carboxypeptidase regulatory-like domain-containing protein [Myxococcales bacterium]
MAPFSKRLLVIAFLALLLGPANSLPPRVADSNENEASHDMDDGAEEELPPLKGDSVIEGSTLFDDGRAFEGVSVSIAGSGVWPPRSVTSNVEGRFSFSGVPAGVYELNATVGHWVSEPIQGIVVEAKDRKTVSFKMEQGLQLAGVVIDAQTRCPIEGAELLLSEYGVSLLPKVSQSDGKGAFLFLALRPVDQRVSVRAQGYIPALGISHHPGKGQITIELTRAATLSGKVVDEEGRPIDGVQLEVHGDGQDEVPIFMSEETEQFRLSLFNQQQQAPPRC